MHPMSRRQMNDNAGFFLMPPQEAGGTVLHVGGVGIRYGITQNAENPDLAAEFINSLVSERALELMVEAECAPRPDGSRRDDHARHPCR